MKAGWLLLIACTCLAGCAAEDSDGSSGQADGAATGDDIPPVEAEGAGEDDSPQPAEPRGDVLPTSDEALLSLLVGAWEASEIADSGNPPEAVPPGSWTLVFNSDLTLSSGCGTAGDPYALEDGVIHLGQDLRWTIVELTEERLGFEEGTDLFFFTRTSCAE